MRYGIFSDIHGNLEALEAVLKAYKDESIDRFVCLGDIVGYGADPLPCIEAVQRLGAVIIAGNHDWGAAGSFGIDFFSAYAKDALVWTREKLAPEHKNFLAKLPLRYIDENIECVHGALFTPENFPYIHTLKQAREESDLMKRPIVFIGHTHRPKAYIFSGGKSQSVRMRQLFLSEGARCIYNAGSVGQPRDGVISAAYCIFDTKKKLVEIKRIAYNIKQTQSKIKGACLPEFLAARLGQGR